MATFLCSLHLRQLIHQVKESLVSSPEESAGWETHILEKQLSSVLREKIGIRKSFQEV